MISNQNQFNSQYQDVFAIIIFTMIRVLKKIYKMTSLRERIRLQRQSRLARGTDAKNLTTKSQDDMSKIRNLGIIAHIDAGKTTTTERMLYYAGALPSPGNIDEGTTAMDFLAQERERGITIRSAAISFNWLNHQINLIDTPGHVDFSGEVTRSLRVLDGVVTILDGVKGVEAQTQKVWAQANKHQIPKICFINKMDRIGSSAEQSAESIKKKLKAEPLLLQMPIGDGDTFRGVIDLIELEQILFAGKFGEEVKKTRIAKNTQKHTHLTKVREKLVSLVGNYDEQIGDMYLNQQYVPSHKLKTAIRKIVTTPKQNGQIIPVLLGASYRNLGVQPLLDAIVSYLPAPIDRMPVHAIDNVKEIRKPNRTDQLTGYVFKVLFDIEKGPLAYTRVYSGQMTKNFQVYNSTKKIPQKINQILRVRANQYVPIQQISAGDIVALSGLKQTEAGDTLTLSGDQFLLQNLDIPNPVFTAPFELETSKYQRQFDEAMKKITIQDTSLSFKLQQQTNQYLVSGLGELHLQILRDRLKGEGIPVKMGNLKINFKQTVSKQSQDHLQIKKQIKPTVFEQFHLKIKLMPLRTEDQKIQIKNEVVFAFQRVAQFDQAWNEFLKKKLISKHPSQRANYTKQQLSKLKKNVRNPTPLQPIYDEQQQVQDGQQRSQKNEANQQEEEEQLQGQELKVKQEQLFYHINTLPFQTLYELHETCQTSILYGKNKLPTMGIQLQIMDGKYKRSSFSKSVMNRCASTLTRQIMNNSTVLIEPIMEFNLSGDQAMIDVALKDVLKKRGRVVEQTASTLTGFIPAQGVRGWIKQLRAMGLQIQLKFNDYEEVIGVNPQKLIQDNL